MQESTATVPPPPAAGPRDEFGLRLLRGRRGHGGLVLTVRVLPAALLLAGLQLLLTGARLSQSWFWQDDLNILATAARRPLTLDLLFSDYNGHLVPGSWVIAWVLDRVAPLQWWPAALLTLLAVAAIDLMMLALLRRLFGDRPAILFPYAMFCATSLVLTSTLWWAAALQWLPVSLSLVTALHFHAGYLRTRRRADAGYALAAVLGGLFFFEKALTGPLVLALFTVVYAVPGPLWRRPWRALRRYPGYWLAQAALAGGFLALYLSRVTIDTGPPVRSADVVEVTRLMIVETLLPSLIGGPLTWYSTPTTTISSWPHPAPWLIVTAIGLTAAAVLGSLVLVRGAWRGWFLLAVYLGISVALVARARLGFIGPFIGRDHRYLTDLAVMAPLGLALAWLPLRDGLDASAEGSEGAVRRQQRRERYATALARHHGVTAGIATLAVLAMTVGGFVSAQRFLSVWKTNPSQQYFANLSSELELSGPVYLFGDEVAPDLVMTPTFLELRRLGHLTRPMKVRPVISEAVPYFSVIDPSGHVRVGEVRGADAVLATERCATADVPATITLPVTVGAGRWKLRLGYYANRQTTARVSIGDNPPVSMRLERGLHEVFVSLLAGGSPQIRLDGIDPGAGICVGSATLGLPGIKP